jgi:hypothetical protein
MKGIIWHMNVAKRVSALVIGLLLAGTPRMALAIDNPLTANLRGSASHLEEATATIFGSGAQVLVDVTRRRGILEGQAVTLNVGTCAHPGKVAYTLAPFGKTGSITQLDASVTTVAARAHSMIVHLTADSSSPAFACGNVID